MYFLDYFQMGPYVLEIQDMEKKIKDLESEVTRTVGKRIKKVV